MEVNIKNPSSRLILEKADNGVILYDVGEDNVVSSKVLYETYFKDGIIDFESIATLMIEVMESLKIPTVEEETNRFLAISVMKIDPEKPALGDDDFEDGEEDDDDE
jgi:hypothetical protein